MNDILRENGDGEALRVPGAGGRRREAKPLASAQEMADRLTTGRDAFRFDRKPERWSTIHQTVRRSVITRVAGSEQVFEEHPRGMLFDGDGIGAHVAWPLEDFRNPPGFIVFLVQMPSGLFLVNTEGSDYARYAAKVVDG